MRSFLLLLVLAGCSRDVSQWNPEAICAAEYKRWQTNHNPNDPAHNFGGVLLGVQKLGGLPAWKKHCGNAIRAATVACSEYERGSDRGLDCEVRRVTPEIVAIGTWVYDYGKTH